MNRRAAIALVVVAIGLAAVLAYVFWYAPGRHGTGFRDAQWDGSPSTLLAAHRGRVLVLLAGMEGCPGTAKGTEFLKTWAAQKDSRVAIVRLDVPPPGEKLAPVDPASLPFGYAVDKDRVVAKELGFFYYATLYIIDPDGEVRFVGDCDPERVPTMVAAILAEKPGDPKHIYTPPLPAIGAVAPAFSAPALDGKTVSLDALRGQRGTVLVFAKTGCSFSVAALPGVQQLAESFRDKGVAVLIVNGREPGETIQTVYAKYAPRVTVINDATGRISASYSGDTVPYSFVLDGAGRVAARMPYTFDDATRAVNQLLGLAPENQGAPATGAG